MSVPGMYLSLSTNGVADPVGRFLNGYTLHHMFSYQPIYADI